MLLLNMRHCKEQYINANAIFEQYRLFALMAIICYIPFAGDRLKRF